MPVHGKIHKAIKSAVRATSRAAAGSSRGRAVQAVKRGLPSVLRAEVRAVKAVAQEAFRTSPQRVVQNNVIAAKAVGSIARPVVRGVGQDIGRAVTTLGPILRDSAKAGLGNPASEVLRGQLSTMRSLGESGVFDNAVSFILTGQPSSFPAKQPLTREMRPLPQFPLSPLSKTMQERITPRIDLPLSKGLEDLPEGRKRFRKKLREREGGPRKTRKLRKLGR